MSKPKTQANDGSVTEFLESIPDEAQRADARELATLLEEVTGQPPVMWGTAIIGFGSYHYKGASGREGDWMAIGFSPRKGKTTVYCMDGFADHQTDLEKLGPHSTAKSCLYLKSLDGVDRSVLKRILTRSYRTTVAGSL